MPCGSSYGHFSYFLRGSGAPQVLRYHLNIPDADVPIFWKIRHNFPLYRGENGANERLVKLLGPARRLPFPDLPSRDLPFRGGGIE